MRKKNDYDHENVNFSSNMDDTDINNPFFDLGFTTGDSLVDKAATILRLLYIEDLRKLQTEVNEIIVIVQEYTQNPITDSRLGVVGI